MNQVRCGTCAFWPARVNKIGRRVVAGSAYRCTVEIEKPTLPASVTMRDRVVHYEQQKQYTEGEDGSGCPKWRTWK